MENVFSRVSELYKKLNPNLFLPAHIILALFIFFRSRGGRYRLSNELMISDSRSRIIYEVLQNNNHLVVASRGRKGSKLTATGQKICNSLFKNLIFLDFDRSWDLEILSVGEINALIAFPLSKEIVISSLEFRDAAMRSGALGATIFKGKLIEEILRLEFYDSKPQTIDKNFTNALNKLGEEIKEYLNPKSTQKEWLIIAGSTSSSKRTTAFPFVHEKSYSSFKVARMAAIQCAWLIIQKL